MQIDCPSCGSSVPLQPFDRFLKCAYCRSTFRVDLGEEIPSLAIKRVVPRGAVPGLLRKALKHHDLNEPVSIRSMKEMYIPFWRFETPQSVQVIPAVSVVDDALDGYKLPAGEESFFQLTESESIDVREPDIFLETAVHKIISSKDFSGSNPPDARISMVYVPFHEVSFEYGDRFFTAYIAGGNGDVLFDRLPTTSSLMLNRSLAFKSILIFLGYVLTTAFSLKSFHSLEATLLLCGLLTIGVFFWLRVSVPE